MTKYIRDYYRILGINNNANSKTIKKAYKNAIHEYNTKYDKDNKKYRLIQEAYQVLSDKNKKSNYDKLYKQAHSKKTNNKKSILTDNLKLIKELNDNYNLLSKEVKTIIGSKRSNTLLTASKLLIGGTATKYGIKKGKNFINKHVGK